MVSLKDSGCTATAHAQAEPSGGPCPWCQRPRCTASSKTRDGERCRKNPHPGASICTNHGLNGAGRAKAARVRQEQEAAELLGRVWNRDAAPVRDAVGAMQRLAGQLEHVVHVLGGQLNVGDICTECGRGNVELDSVKAVAWIRVLRELRQLLSDMQRLGIAEQMVQVEASKVRLMSLAFGKVLDELGLPEAERERLARVLLTEMRALVAAEQEAS